MRACSSGRGVVGAVEGAVAQRRELRRDPVEPAGVGRGVGQLDVVLPRQSPTRESSLVDRCGLKLSSTIAIRVSRGQSERRYRTDARNVVRFLVAWTWPELDSVPGQVVAGDQVPPPGGARGGGPPAPPRLRPTAAAGGPLSAGMRLPVQRCIFAKLQVSDRPRPAYGGRPRPRSRTGNRSRGGWKQLPLWTSRRHRGWPYTPIQPIAYAAVGATIASYDGFVFIFVTPEYDHGISGALKNRDRLRLCRVEQQVRRLRQLPQLSSAQAVSGRRSICVVMAKQEL